MSPKPSDPHNTLAEFQAKAASVIKRLAAKMGTSESRLSRDLEAAGIAAQITPGDDGSVIAVQIPADHGLPRGYERSDFSDAKLAELDAKAVNAAKEQVFQLIRSRSRNGYCTPEEASEALSELGFTTLPTTQTTVRWYAKTGSRDRYGDEQTESFHVVLPGNVTTEEAAEMLRPHVTEPTGNAVIQAAFPNAVSTSEQQPYELQSLYVDSNVNWPYHSEFAS